MHVFAFSLALASGQALAQAYVPGEIIVKLKSDSGSSDSYAFLGKATAQRKMILKESWGRMNMHHFGLRKGQSTEQALQELRRDPDVLYAEPNYLLTKTSDVGIHQAFSADEVQSAAVTSMASSFMATGANIGAQSVWSANSAPSTKPIVAVIDTGLDALHSVFVNTNSIWINPGEIPGNGLDDDGNGYVDDVKGWNFVDNSGTMYDDDGHGTHVSGIILSLDQNIYATPLRTSKVLIMPLKFLNGSGVGNTSDAIRAIYYAVNNGATIINNSWGGTSYSAALHEAVAYSYSKGVLFVAAAGNAAANNDSVPMYPASYDVPNVVAVAATTDYDYLASFSNYGKASVHFGSPGVYILSTIPNGGFGTSSGTSMAAPFVAGTAAQMKVGAPTMLGYQMRTILTSTNATVAQLNNKVITSGRLNSSSAVTQSKTAAIETTQPAYTLTYQGDRELASNIAGGAGCGTVRALSDGGPGAGSAAALALVLLPVLVLVVMRLRSPANRRRFERFKVDSDVRISVGGRDLVGSVSSISLGGAQVNTSALLQDGGLITMAISSPDGKDKIEVAGRVVWVDANKSYGVAFDHAPQSALTRIADWTKALKPSEG